MGNKKERALELYDAGFSCSQSVFGAFCEDYGVALKTGLQLSNGLAGGVQQADICGAVSGAALVVGLRHGQFDANDKASRQNCNKMVREFLAEFKGRHGSTACRELLGLDASTPEGRAEAMKNNLFKTVCRGLIDSAAAILEEQGY